jgi:hypothetical protein
MVMMVSFVVRVRFRVDRCKYILVKHFSGESSGFLGVR